MGLFDKFTSALSSEESDSSDQEEEPGPFSIPEWAVEDMVNVKRRTEIIQTHYQGVRHQQATKIAEILKENLETTEGWSLDDMIQDVADTVDVSEELTRRIIRTEVASITTIDKAQTYLERERSDGFVFKWQGPSDDRTHPICAEVKEEIENRGGGVPLNELQRLLTETARKYENQGGTPERMDHWVPHEKCRHTLNRHIEM